MEVCWLVLGFKNLSVSLLNRIVKNKGAGVYLVIVKNLRNLTVKFGSVALLYIRSQWIT